MSRRVIGYSRRAMVATRPSPSPRSAPTDPASGDDASSPPWLERIARIGLVGKAVLYTVVGLLAALLARGGRQDDGAAGSTGAIEWIGERSWGTPALLVLAVSLAGLAFWRLAATVTGDPVEGDGVRERATFAAKAVFYGALAVLAARGALGGSSGGDQGSSSGGSSGGGGGASDAASTVFDLPAGRWLVLGVGLAVLGIAVYVFAVHTIDRRFLQRVRASRRSIVSVLGRVGYGGRSLAYAVVGGFLIRAAVQHDPSQAKSLGESLRALADSAPGRVALYVVAVGFVASGIFCLFESRLRRDA